jgi:hypothetical protein
MKARRSNAAIKGRAPDLTPRGGETFSTGPDTRPSVMVSNGSRPAETDLEGGVRLHKIAGG